MSLPPHALSYIAAAAQCQDSRAQYIWLDVDPGHDDALAILAAVHLPQIAVLGVSAVHGNASLPNTTLNAARCLEAFGAPPEIAVYAGCSRPLLRPRVDAADIHGSDGLGGVEGLRTLSDAAVLGRVNRSGGLHPSTAIALACEVAQKRGKKLTLVAAGPLTNVALFVSLYPLLVRDALAEIVIMGGAVGVGNKTPVAEYNIVCDPDAAQIVLDAEVIVRMIPSSVPTKQS
ncbi:hypothetical protein E5Q_03738 [Mixia osmundae IAM 14324]|uniref:Inosine/uridine-preferring nucleoside hydrolase domain-containing protein n=1 Tax=Mixia osmundae (strain CBS 9802 / IAM 14324 / JCM 22182 / KY 12970) TaxID=764103 RepID=G7E2K3_MIXOS|nr:hypothetical protein E5Q_03738 [Mixia osmundae IAM 14324]